MSYAYNEERHTCDECGMTFYYEPNIHDDDLEETFLCDDCEEELKNTPEALQDRLDFEADCWHEDRRDREL